MIGKRQWFATLEFLLEDGLKGVDRIKQRITKIVALRDGGRHVRKRDREPPIVLWLERRHENSARHLYLRQPSFTPLCRSIEAWVPRFNSRCSGTVTVRPSVCRPKT